MQAALAAQRTMQVTPALHSSFSGLRLAQRCPVVKASRPAVARAVVAAAAAETDERFRLGNLSPQPGAKRDRKRKGRGYGAGQGGTCGFGMRGQKSRSGSGIRPGFEGGQTPLYRRLPKLKGIAGGMGAGLPDYVTINLRDLGKFAGGEEVSLESLEEKRIINLSGRETKLPLKVLGTGDLSLALKVHAAAFSASAKAKIEAAGGEVILEAQKPTWTRKAHEAALRAEAKK